jgi:hypothetical protein
VKDDEKRNKKYVGIRKRGVIYNTILHLPGNSNGNHDEPAKIKAVSGQAGIRMTSSSSSSSSINSVSSSSSTSSCC